MARLQPSQSQFKRGDGMSYLSSSWVTISQLNAIVVIDLRISILSCDACVYVVDSPHETLMDWAKFERA